MEEEIINWCLGLGNTPDDWTMDGDSIKLRDLPTLYLKDDTRFEYNQGKSNDCTIYWTIGAISDLFNYEFSTEEIEEINEESYKAGRTRGEWWYVQSAVKLVCKWWNERHKDQTVAYYFISKYETDVIEEVLKKNYTLVTGYYGSSSYNKDRDDNIQIDDKYRWETSYWHCLDVVWKDDRKTCKDSYKGRTSKGRDSNFYGFIPNFADCNTRHNGFYLIVPEGEQEIEDKKRLNKMKNMINTMIETTEKAIELNSQMRESTNDTVYQNRLHTTNEKLRFILRCHNIKKDDIERELNKYFR